jgi:DNA-directed RNA polymerase II subunit RPB1
LIYSNSFEDIAAISVAVITSPESFESGSVKKEGLFDLRLGPLDKGKCESCGRGVRDCPGHFGHIELEYP